MKLQVQKALNATEKLKDLAVESESLISEMEQVLEDLLDVAEKLKPVSAFYDEYKGCSEEVTWVLNKVGEKYHYCYLKCPEKKPSSIYLGSCIGWNALKNAFKTIAEFVAGIEKLSNDIETLKTLASELKEAAETIESIRLREEAKEQEAKESKT